MPALVLALLTAAPFSPAGLELHLSDCASGGVDYYFFQDGTVLTKCSGCEWWPLVQRGRWKVERDVVQVAIEHEWYGKGEGRVVEAASVDVFEDYVAVSAASTEKQSFEVERFREEPRSCERVRPHRLRPDPHGLLRLFDGDWPETAERELKAADVAGKSRATLRLMRNEIYARYGYRFHDAALTAQFKKHKAYRPHLRDVEAFLSDVERRNVVVLSEAEKKAAQ
ncbi:MAG: YARHG domain-containing protein [Myxococcota bacterium]